MVELKDIDQAASERADGTQGGNTATQETSRNIATVADLNEEQLDGIFSEEDPHKQFEILDFYRNGICATLPEGNNETTRFFTSCLGLPRPESMSTLSRIAAEYDYLNVMFCREQNFTVEQTIAFRGITQSVFEAGIVRGELDVNEAFQEFTERVLSLAGETDTPPQEHSSPGNKPPATDLTPGACANGDGVGGGGSPPATVTRSASGSPPKLNAGGKAKELVVDPNKSVGKGDPSTSPGGGNSGAEETRDGVGNSGGSGDGSGGGSGGGGGEEAGPVFSVGDVAAITLFVARGLYRNFALYRMCFEQQAKYCIEVRYVQVETPLEPPPLHEAELTV